MTNAAERLIGVITMGEYIDREKLLKRFNIDDMMNVNGTLISLRDAREVISNFPTVSVPQWISVKDKLPEDGENVLIWYEYFRYGSYNRMFQTHGIGYQFNGNWSGVDPLGHKARVFAWMPLPIPPKGENDG